MRGSCIECGDVVVICTECGCCEDCCDCEEDDGDDGVGEEEDDIR